MKELSQEQLELQLKETCRERLEAKMKAASDKTVGHKCKKLRRDIARVLTELRSREIAAAKG
ncbi:MAG: 50S ribosomal protein L29 [Planctomycetaceae bacterium]